MSSVIETEKRFLFPSWKSFEETLKSGELIGLHKSKESEFIIDFKKIDLNKSIEKWKNKKNLFNAAEVIAQANMLEQSNSIEIYSIAKYIIDNSDDAGELLIKSAKSIVNEKEEIYDFNLSVETLKENAIQEIRKYKHMLKREPNFAVGHIELGRLYTFLGQNDIAEYHIYKALLLKSDRFILRSAARFYIHKGEFDNAFDLLARSENASKDPWILSGIMGLGEKIGKTKNYISKAQNLIKNFGDNHFQFAELKSALGTTILLQGDRRKSKKLFNESLFNPTDNSLAQVFWYWKILEENQFSNYNESSEANTLIQYRNKNFEDSFLACKKWIQEEPLSSRALNIASYTSSVFLEKYDEAIKIAKYGLELNPDDIGLKNNLAYDLILSGNIDEAEKTLNSLTNITDTKLSNVINATTGLLQIQKGNYDIGKAKYFESIDFFRKNNEEYSECLAFLNFLNVVLEKSPNYSLNLAEQELLNKSKKRKEFDIDHFLNKIELKLTK